MSAKTINIYVEAKGNDVEKSFDAVVNLVQNGFLTREDEILSATKDRIEIEGVEFKKMYADELKTAAEFKLTETGATWFRSIGTESQDAQYDSAARWQKFLEMVSGKIHKQYSFFEYSPRLAEVEGFVLQTDKSMIYKLYQLLKSDKTKYAETSNSATTLPDDISIIADTCAGENDVLYGVTLRLAVSDGSGEALPILGKIFFRLNQDEQSLQPLGKRQAQSLSSYINSCVTGVDQKRHSEISKAGDINDYSGRLEGVKTELKKLFESELGFQDYLYLFDARDRDLLDGLVERGPNNEVHISCRSAKILSIFYLNWQQRCYYVKGGGSILYQVLIGYNNSITVSCRMCRGGHNILDGNRLVLTDDAKTVLQLEPERDDFGLDEDQLELLHRFNPFVAHANRKICKNVKFGKECVKYVCDEQLFDVDQAAYPKTVLKKDRCQQLCKDCDNIERVAMYKGKHFHTVQMTYASDIRGLIPQNEAKICSVCGRTFAVLSTKGTLCVTCEKLQSGIMSELQRKLYRKYATALSPLKRLKVTKRSVEDDEIILIKVAECIYRLEKCDLDGRTILSAPKRVDKR